MFLQLFSILALFILPGSLACEGECIVGITNAWIGNYTYEPLREVVLEFHDAVSKLVPSNDKIAGYYGTPVLENFATEGLYDKMSQAMFPGFFHGKCVDAEGKTPPGCPNPSCPVVCGTPGSMVYHYPKVTSIAYDVALAHLQNLLKPGSQTRKKLETLLLREAAVRRSYIRGRAGSPSSSKDILQRLHELTDALLKSFADRCGGGRCNWETHMKKFILSFP